MISAKSGAVIATALGLAFVAGHAFGQNSAVAPSPRVITHTKTVTVTERPPIKVVKVVPKECLDMQVQIASYMQALAAYNAASAPTLDVESDAGKAIFLKSNRLLNAATEALRQIGNAQTEPFRQMNDQQALLNHLFRTCREATK